MSAWVKRRVPSSPTVARRGSSSGRDHSIAGRDLHRGNDIPRPRDRTPKIAFWPETISAETETQPQKPANCGHLGRLREILRFERLRGGPERTRTACQARSHIEPISETSQTARFVGLEPVSSPLEPLGNGISRVKDEMAQIVSPPKDRTREQFPTHKARPVATIPPSPGNNWNGLGGGPGRTLWRRAIIVSSRVGQRRVSWRRACRSASRP